MTWHNTHEGALHKIVTLHACVSESDAGFWHWRVARLNHTTPVTLAGGVARSKTTAISSAEAIMARIGTEVREQGYYL